MTTRPVLVIGNKNYSSWSLRPWLLLRQHGVMFDEMRLPLDTPEFAGAIPRWSPSGRVPALRHGELVVWDSLAITEYLAERYGRVWPLDPEARAFARCAAAEMHSGFSGLRNACSMVVGIRVELNEIGPALAADLERITALWTEGLSRFGGPFLAGKRFTAADAFFCPVAFRAQTYNILTEGVAGHYVQTLLDLTAMREWYNAALAETFRDPPHEADIEKYGKLTADFRLTA